MNYHFAPVQGHTDAPYRHFHNAIYGDKINYYTPFIRLENGEIRKRDIKDITSELNKGFNNIPQIIFRNEHELSSLISILKEIEVDRIDLNMGCPFPLQTGHHRGAATIADKELISSIVKIIKENSDINFSIKMRLGLTDPEEWKSLLDSINKVKLSHLTVHPRVARQQYSGDLFYDQYERILRESENPIVFNGEIKTPEDAKTIIERFPTISGIMVGRGLLGRPSLMHEIISGKEWSQEDRIDYMLRLHRNLLSHYEKELCGESQILSKIQPFWEYAENEIGRKAWKAIKKACNMAKYKSAVAMINS